MTLMVNWSISFVYCAYKKSSYWKARQFFVRARQVRTGLAQTASEGRWAHCKLTSRAGMAGAVSRWLGSVEGLAEIAQRLLRVQIENAPALEVIKRYDSPETLFYCDPPYVHESRSDTNAYAFEMSDDEHRALAQVLHNVKGKVALSGYQCNLMDELYGDWHYIKAEPTAILEDAFRRASKLKEPTVNSLDSLNRIVEVVRCLNNRAGVRMLLTCALAKLDRPEIDIRKPYTEIGDPDTFSGRGEYDEVYIGPFVSKFGLPANATTAFLTPGFRTINVPLTPMLTINGRPKQMYVDTILLLDDVFHNRITADELLVETFRQLLLLKEEQEISCCCSLSSRGRLFRRKYQAATGA